MSISRPMPVGYTLRDHAGCASMGVRMAGRRVCRINPAMVKRLGNDEYRQCQVQSAAGAAPARCCQREWQGRDGPGTHE